APVFVGYVARERVVRTQVFGVSERATGCIQSLRVRLRKLECPLLGIQGIDLHGLDVPEDVTGLHLLARPVRVEKHPVVRIVEVPGEEPGLALRSEVLTLSTQPGNTHR